LSVITDLSELQSLSEQWNRLAISSSATIYQTNQWAACWWKHFGNQKGQTLHCLTAFHENKLVGILPLYQERIFLGGSVVRTRMGFIGEGNAYHTSAGMFFDNGPSDYLDIIILPEFETRVCRLFIDYLLDQKLQIDSVDFVNVPEKSILKTLFVPELQQRGIACKTQQADICPYLPLPGSMEEYFHSLSSSVRRRLSQAQRAATEESLYTINGSATLQECEDALHQIIILHQQRWNRVGYPGLFADKRFTAFQFDILRLFHENGWLWCKTANTKGSCIAARLAFQFGNRFYDYLSGFDDATVAAKRRPGLALLLSMIQDGIAQQYATVDFLRGDEQYKFELTEQSRYNWNITIHVSPQKLNSLRSKISDGIRLGKFLAQREGKLFGVQFRQAGFPRCIVRYIEFRTPRLRRKMKSIFSQPGKHNGHE
ncbi:MAG TPA: GNAT family N-acetyltransferase, partial [Bacteroidota bacterium]|nr:GNAT family N-acetyltransferase [Bacteroidota bacterium]